MSRVKRNLDCLFRPRSMAVIGASSTPGKRGHVLLTNMARMEYEGRVYPIHPSNDFVLGHRCYRSLSDLPERPDVVAVCLAAEAVPAIVDECGRAGIGALAVVAAGFADAGPQGEDLQRRMLEAAERSGVSIMGPNGIGIVNRLDRVQYWMTAPDVPLYRDRAPSGVSVVLQSGALGLTVTNDGLERGLALDYVISAGSGVSLDVADYLDWMLDDTVSKPKVIGCVVEGLNKPDLFRNVARRALAHGTAIVVLRSGRASRTRALIASHTGSMVGSAEVADEIFAADGVISVADMDQWMEQLVLHAHAEKPAGRRWFMLSPSGGGNAVISDIAAEIGLEAPPAPESVVRAMRAIGDRAVQNPFDCAGYYDAPGIDEQAIGIAVADPEVDAVIGWLSMFPIPNRGHTRILKALAAHAARAPKPVLMFSFTAGPVGEFSLEILRSGGMYPLKGGRNSLLALKRWFDWHERQRAAAERDSLPQAPHLAPIGADMPKGNIEPELARRVLAGAGLSLAPGAIIEDGEVAEAFSALHGFPLVLKLDHPDLLHKTEVGGVIVGVNSADALHAAIERLRAETIPRISLSGVKLTVQKQLLGGVELLLSARKDSVFGAYVVVGLGGIHTELFKDFALRPAPLDLAGAQAMLRSLKSWPLLDGFRNGPKYDQSAAAQAIVQLSRLALAMGPRLDTIEMNPVIVMPAGEGAWVVDVVMTLA